MIVVLVMIGLTCLYPLILVKWCETHNVYKVSEFEIIVNSINVKCKSYRLRRKKREEN